MNAKQQTITLRITYPDWPVLYADPNEWDYHSLLDLSNAPNNAVEVIDWTLPETITVPDDEACTCDDGGSAGCPVHDPVR